jgi:hypothetical protein
MQLLEYRLHSWKKFSFVYRDKRILSSQFDDMHADGKFGGRQTAYRQSCGSGKDWRA